MKRIVTLLLLFVFIFMISISALAEGEKSVTQKNFYAMDSSFSTYGYLFAKVENVGDEAIYLDSGKLVVFDSNDEIIETSDYVSAYPRYLEPGEYAYVRDWSILDVNADAVADYKFSIGTTNVYNTTTRFACETGYDPGDTDYTYDDYMYATFTNTSDETVYGVYAVLALLDADGNILDVSYDVANSFGVHAGSTVTMRVSVDSDIVEYLQENKIEPTSVDALIYVENDD
jgi:hypothetical protein